MRNDSSCGSTIGPMTSTALGIRTVDVGIAQHSMHSIRESCGVKDVFLAYKLLVAYFMEFRLFDQKTIVDAAAHT